MATIQVSHRPSKVSPLRLHAQRPPVGPRHLPRWWHEVALVLAIYVAYDVTRGFVGAHLSSADGHGQAILSWEQAWHLDPEHALNNGLAHVELLAVAASYFYATMHYVVTPAVLIWLYRSHAAAYVRARSVLAIGTLLGLVGFWLLPTTPPRLLPGQHFHDTLASVSQWGWWGAEGSAPRGLGGLTDQLAAMPSLHVGWALWAGWLIARHARHRVSRVVGAAYPVVTVLVVLGTGNHYLADALAGAGVMVLAAGLARAATALRGHARVGTHLPATTHA